MTINRFWIDQRKIELDPVYQREAGVWSDSKKRLLIDSLLNGYDIPKIYMAKLADGGPFDYAVIDGKQRISTILGFINDEFSLESDFEYSGQDLELSDRPSGNQKFSNFTERAKEVFKGVQLSVVTVEDADDEDIESLFARLNNGEPLNSAEQRNAIGGDMAALIRDFADRPFFKTKVKFSNKRFSHREVSCKLLYMEWQRIKTNQPHCPDLKKKYLDNFVKDNRVLNQADKEKLTRETDLRLKDLSKCFEDNSTELSKQSYPQYFLLFLRFAQDKYTHANLLGLIKGYLPLFTALRVQNNLKPEDERDPVLVEFGRLTQQGTNDAGSMTQRAETLLKYFLVNNPAVQPKDTRRSFNPIERYVIWVLADKKCQKCNCELGTIDEMDADHEMRFIDGGSTTLSNGRCLCIPCNRRDEA
jgi:hypothetical protein